MKKLLSILTIIICCVAVTITVFAHPGRTDSNGGHHVTATGEYHYHHGYPAHSHSGGVCPYDFDTKINSTTPTSENPQKPQNTFKKVIYFLSILLLCPLVIFGPYLISKLFKLIKSIFSKRS